MLNENKPFKELFDHFSEEPDTFVWLDLKKELIEKRKKKRVAFWLLFSCFSLVLTGIALSLTDNDPVESQIQSGSIEPASHSALEARKTVQNSGSGQSQKHPADKSVESSIDPSPVYIKPATQEQESETVDGNEELHSASLAQSSEFQTEREFSSLKPLPRFPFEIDSDLNSSTIALIHKTHKPSPAPISKELYLDFSLSGSQAGLLKTDEQKELILKGNALGLDFKVIKQVRRFEFGIGLNYTYSKTEGEHNWNKADIFLDSIIVKKRYTNEIRYYHFNDTNYINTMDRYQNRIQYLSMPVSIGYNSNSKGKFNTYVKANFQFGYLFNSSFNTNYDKASGVMIENSKADRHRLVYGAGIQIGFLYSINDKTQLNLGINSNVLSLASALNHRQHLLPYTTGLSIGIRKKINFSATNH